MKDRVIGIGLLFFASVVYSFAQDVNIGTLIGGADEADPSADPDNKIANGRVAGPHPYQIQLLSNGQFICSGSIINKQWILTAAHCVKGHGGFQIVAGTKNWMDTRGGKLYNTEFSTYHQGFDERKLANDIALIKTQEPIQFSSSVQPIEIGEKMTSAPGKVATIAGWGGTERARLSKIMLETRLKVISTQECQRYWPQVTDTHLCTFETAKDSVTCPGDSGGPLTLDGLQVGIVSFGSPGCPATSGNPDVFTKVGYFKDWINNQIYSHDKGGSSTSESGGRYGSSSLGEYPGGGSYQPPRQGEYPGGGSYQPPRQGGYPGGGSYQPPRQGGYPGGGSYEPPRQGGYPGGGRYQPSRGGSHGGSGGSRWGMGGRYIPGYGFFAEEPKFGDSTEESIDEPEIVESASNV